MLGLFRKVREVRQKRGQDAERLAAAYLQANGFEVLEHNVRFPVGEIDLIAQEGHTLCFVEVRSTSSLKWGGPLASITEEKRRKVIRAARWYLRGRKLQPSEMRFDVVAIDWKTDGSRNTPSIQLIRAAFTA